MNAEKWKHQVLSQHRGGTSDLSWEVREGVSEKLQLKELREMRKSRPGSRTARALR